jgi:hypothetical protein
MLWSKISISKIFWSLSARKNISSYWTLREGESLGVLSVAECETIDYLLRLECRLLSKFIVTFLSSLTTELSIFNSACAINLLFLGEIGNIG